MITIIIIIIIDNVNNFYVIDHMIIFTRKLRIDYKEKKINGLITVRFFFLNYNITQKNQQMIQF